MIINDKRALAYIVTIDEIRPIPNYDRVEQARTNGWWCVTRLNELKVGDKAVYFEVDSKVPADDERFSFLEAKHYKIKTQKMCGVFSQGLLMPITLFPELVDMEVGTDVTDILKVTYSVVEDNTRKSKNSDPNAKYKSMAQRHRKIFKKPIVRKIMRHKLGRKIMFLFFGRKKDKPLSFPTQFPFVHKTDEERCENIPWVLGYERPLIVTEKLDGCLDRDVSVVTDAGSFKISEIVNKKLPVNVLTYNSNLNICEYKPIVDYHKWERVSDMYDIVVSQQGYKCGNKPKHICCTSEHSFYVGNNQYIKAKDLKNTDIIYHRYAASNGSSITPTKIISVRKIDNYNRKYVFDLTVKDNHNYFANGILTHNTSSTYILERKDKKKFEFYVLSRNVRQKTPDQKCYHDKNIYWDMAIKNNIEQHLKEYLIANPDLKYVCIQGESVGSVQGNPLKLDEDELYVFNFIRSDVGRLSSIDGKEIIESWGMKFVPILETEYYVPTDMEAFKEYATAKSVVNPNVLREGIVLRDPTNDFSFKNVSREYLLKHGG